MQVSCVQELPHRQQLEALRLLLEMALTDAKDTFEQLLPPEELAHGLAALQARCWFWHKRCASLPVALWQLALLQASPTPLLAGPACSSSGRLNLLAAQMHLTVGSDLILKKDVAALIMKAVTHAVTRYLGGGSSDELACDLMYVTAEDVSVHALVQLSSKCVLGCQSLVCAGSAPHDALCSGWCGEPSGLAEPDPPPGLCKCPARPNCQDGDFQTAGRWATLVCWLHMLCCEGLLLFASSAAVRLW